MNIKHLIKSDYFSGLLLLAAALFAVILSNSPLSWLYDHLLETPVAIQIGALKIDKPLLLWINDGLMAIFFFLIGLEIKREIIEGELSSIRKASLPLIAALGGLILPALIYMYLNHSDDYAMKGWAVPVATDIAFALGVLSLLGKRVPRNLKMILLSLAIIDDIGAILIIAIFYSHGLSFVALGLSFVGLFVAFLLNRFGVSKISPYILVGIVVWVCLLKSGVHATLAGVALAFMIPFKSNEAKISPLKTLEHSLHPWVALMIMPLFAFSNAGVSLEGMSLGTLAHPLPLGIILGLFVGKQVGVFSSVFIAAKLKISTLPKDVSWRQLYGLSVLCGIGFTMSLFIGMLAFKDPNVIAQVRLSVLVGSLISAVVGYSLLRYFKPKKVINEPDVSPFQQV